MPGRVAAVPTGPGESGRPRRDPHAEDSAWDDLHPAPLGQAPMSTPHPHSSDAFTIERHGELTLVSANPELETLEFGLEEQVAELIMRPLRDQDGPLVVFDLSEVDYFGSMFLA